jgi:hypothetical protein
MTSLIEGMTDITVLDKTVSIKTRVTDDAKAQLDEFADAVLATF